MSKYKSLMKIIRCLVFNRFTLDFFKRFVIIISIIGTIYFLSEITKDICNQISHKVQIEKSQDLNSTSVKKEMDLKTSKLKLPFRKDTTVPVMILILIMIYICVFLWMWILKLWWDES